MNPQPTEVFEMSPTLGTDVSTAFQQAAALAQEKGVPVHFVFNGSEATVNPGDQPEVAQKLWSDARDAAYEAWINSPEFKGQEATRIQQDKEAGEAIMVSDPSLDEFGLRDAKVPWPKTPKQLGEYIESLIHRDHDYGTVVYAMSMAAVAAINYVACELGASGFQASCADIDIIRRTRRMEAPFILLSGENMLYPQLDPFEKLEEAVQEWRPWLKEEAVKKLAADITHAHPGVRAHWEVLAAFEPEEELVTD